MTNLKEDFFRELERILSYLFLLIIFNIKEALRDKCPYSEFFWSLFSRIRTDYGEILRIFPYSVRMRENKAQKNSEYGHLSYQG